ncbi:TetR/AcrR family transcriptional regulator [Phytomonospora sp. NPDC050363]|uniref:TetR/AcrR family transcriptional regulator n=1 Tax=Phytomonospora sp. NPDC050363 TaxID=3155642 RepID=UPI00340B6E37
MARTKGDHLARRREVAEAVWRVLADKGFGGLSMRAVATELGATTGLLTHYFPAKRDLVAYALELLEQRTDDNRPHPAERGLAGLRTALLNILPLTPRAAASNRTWMSSWDAALADPGLSGDHARRYAAGRDRLHEFVAEAQALGELPDGDPARMATGAQAFVLGLVVQSVLDPESFPPARQRELVDDYLRALAGSGAGQG